MKRIGIQPSLWQPFMVLIFVLLAKVGSAQSTTTQQQFQGIIYDLKTSNPIEQVLIKNLNSGLEAESGKGGVFSLPANLNDLITFYYPGYRRDTLLVTEFELKRVYLTSDGDIIRIDEINIRFISDEQLEIEIEKAKNEGKFAETSQSQGGIRLSPSRIFGREGKQARERYPLLVQEKERRIVERRFSASTIQQVTPLTGDDLQIFMTHYRPEKDFVLKSDDQTFFLYIMDSYADFKKLSPEEKAKLKLEQKQNQLPSKL